MSLPSFATKTLLAKRAPLMTDHGSQVRDWQNADTHELTGCDLQPAGGSEDLDGRNSTTTIKKLFGELDTDLLVSDRVVDGDDEYEIQGPIAIFDSGVLDHIEATVEKVAG